MTSMPRAAWAALSIALLAGGVAAAQTPPPSATKTTSSAKPAPLALDAFEQAMAARQVADFARRQKDPQALIVAARMLREVPFKDSAQGGGGPAAFTAEGLFQEARDLAKGDQALLMQINLAQSAGSRGVMSSAFGNGLVRIVQAMSARSVYSFPIRAKAGELLRIGAIGDVNTRMVMRVLDAKGKVLCEDDSGDYAPVCSLRPQGGPDYKVELRNRSDNATRAVILSN